jgi:hypothetical protein
MRQVLFLIMVCLLPVLMLAHRNYFVNHDQERLLAQVKAALDDPMFSGVDREHLSMNFMDVTLKGFVETPEIREKARQKVDAIHGVRCREEDNHLEIPARLTAKMKQNALDLGGWLPGEELLHSVTQWLEQMRPGLQLDTSEVRLSPFVTHTEEPTTSPLPAVYQEVLDTIRTNALLRVERKGDALKVTGALPSRELENAVKAALAGDKKTVPLETGGLVSGPYVKSAHFAQAAALPAFLKDFFGSPQSEFFEADGNTVKLRGVATLEMEAHWRELLLPLAERQEVAADLLVYPTRFHFPNYVPESKLPPEVTEKLRGTLKQAVFHFDPNHSDLLASEMPKFNAASTAIAGAGRDAKILVGGFQETGGDPKAQQQAAVRRCETVIAEFKDRGLPTALFEMVIYSPLAVPNDGGHNRAVELLLK